MWANDISLWQWAHTVNPHASQAKGNLLHAYIRDRNYDAAHALGSEILSDPAPCASCMIFIAKLAIDDGDIPRASEALKKLEHSPLLALGDMLHSYRKLPRQADISEVELLAY
ncbi:hypothetical protein GCM10027066_17360 [Dyella jejuensis]